MYKSRSIKKHNHLHYNGGNLAPEIYKNIHLLENIKSLNCSYVSLSAYSHEHQYNTTEVLLQNLFLRKLDEKQRELKKLADISADIPNQL